MTSLITKDRSDRCFLCSKFGVMHKHHIFGASRRNASEKHGLFVHLCVECHTQVHGKYGAALMQYLHELGQRAYEDQIGSREQFIDEFIRSYL